MTYGELVNNLRQKHRAYVATDNPKAGQIFLDAANAIEELDDICQHQADEIRNLKEQPTKKDDGGSVLIKDMKMPKNCLECPMMTDYDTCGFYAMHSSRSELEAQWNARPDDCPLVEIPPHGRLIDADALKGRMERNLWAIEDKAEKELGFDETLRRGMQYGHAVCLDTVNDTTVILGPIIVHCCECEYNNHCLTQAFVEDASKIPFDKNTWFCADAKAAHTIIPAEEGE